MGMKFCSRDYREKKRVFKGVTAVLLAVVLLAGCGRSYSFEEQALDGSYVFPTDEYLKYQRADEQMKEAASRSGIQIQINAEPEADRSSGRCNLMVGNPAENKDDLKVKLTLDESGALVYESPVLKPGERQAYVTLEVLPESGVYSATAEFLVLSDENGAQTGAVEAGVILSVR